MAVIERPRPDVGSVVWTQLRLPPFPQVAIRILQLANKENVQLHQLSDLISSDPAFASEVLTIANSLLYAPRYPSNSILQAVAVMGINNLQGMCLTVGARVYMGKASSSSLHAANLAPQHGHSVDRRTVGFGGIHGQRPRLHFGRAP